MFSMLAIIAIASQDSSVFALRLNENGSKRASIPIEVPPGCVAPAPELLQKGLDIESEPLPNIQIATYKSFNSTIKQLVKGARALEIGGPSKTFKQMGLYAYADIVDNMNFNAQTMWSSGADGGAFTAPGAQKQGTLIVSEMICMQKTPDASYDAVLSSHNIEHTANPLKALSEIARVLKKGGHLIAILPYKEKTFDHNRNVTTFSHLLNNYREAVDEHDLTDLDSIVAMHDIKRDPGCQPNTKEYFKERSLDNYNMRGLHHHVFDFTLLYQSFRLVGLQPRLEYFALVEPFHQVVVATK